MTIGSTEWLFRARRCHTELHVGDIRTARAIVGPVMVIESKTGRRWTWLFRLFAIVLPVPWNETGPGCRKSREPNQ